MALFQGSLIGMRLFSLSNNGGFLDSQIFKIHRSQFLGGLRSTHKPGAFAPGVHPRDREEVGFSGSRISCVKIVVGVEVHQIHLPLRQPLGPPFRGLPLFSVFSLGFSNHSSSLIFKPVKVSASRWAISRWVNTPQLQDPISQFMIKSPTLQPGAGGP